MSEESKSQPTSPSVDGEPLRSSGRAECSLSKTWTAGIDALRRYPYWDESWHIHAVEFRHKDKAEVEAIQDRWLAVISSRSEAPVAGDDDPLSDLVGRFSMALLKKLRLAQANGRSGWELDDWEKQCQQGLLHHVEKGDPRDVAAYCAFMWHHGWVTAAPSPAALDPVTVEACAKFVEQNQETISETSNGSKRQLSPRKVGNLTGIAYVEGIRALAGSDSSTVRAVRWRHKKRGSVVTEIARGFAQVSHHPIEEMTAVVIYRHDADGRYWVRNAVEFDDGRFESVSQTPTTCQKCGTPTNGKEALVDGQIWCHPCADAATSNVQASENQQ
jgi:hypothetical protein